MCIRDSNSTLREPDVRRTSGARLHDLCTSRSCGSGCSLEGRVLDAIRSLLEQSPMLALFATIGLGYAIGRVSIAGFSLGVGAVLFAGLALGAIAPKAAPPALVSSIGLA